MARLLLPILIALAGALPAQAGDTDVSLQLGAANSSGIDESLVDYALSDAVSVGALVRWVQVGDVDHHALFDTIRSHEPVRADGTTPFDATVALGNLDCLTATFSLKYRF